MLRQRWTEMLVVPQSIGLLLISASSNLHNQGVTFDQSMWYIIWCPTWSSWPRLVFLHLRNLIKLRFGVSAGELETHACHLAQSAATHFSLWVTNFQLITCRPLHYSSSGLCLDFLLCIRSSLKISLVLQEHSLSQVKNTKCTVFSFVF